MADMSRKKQSVKCRGACHEKSRNQKNSCFPLLKVWKQHPNKSELSFIEVRRRLWSVFLGGKMEWGGEQARLSSLSLSLFSTPRLFFSMFLGTTAGPELFLAVLLSIFRKLPVFRHLMGKDCIKTQRVGTGRRFGTQVGRLLLISNAMRTSAALSQDRGWKRGRGVKNVKDLRLINNHESQAKSAKYNTLLLSEAVNSCQPVCEKGGVKERKTKTSLFWWNSWRDESCTDLFLGKNTQMCLFVSSYINIYIKFRSDL